LARPLECRRVLGGDLRSILENHLHPSALNRVQVRAARDEGDLFPGSREQPADVSADRTGADHGDLHFASFMLVALTTTGDAVSAELTARMCARSGLRMNNAIAAAMKFEMLAARNTLRHPPPDAAITLVSGTSSAAVPFAVYSSPAFALANFEPNVSAHV